MNPVWYSSCEPFCSIPFLSKPLCTIIYITNLPLRRRGETWLNSQNPDTRRVTFYSKSTILCSYSTQLLVQFVIWISNFVLITQLCLCETAWKLSVAINTSPRKVYNGFQTNKSSIFQISLTRSSSSSRFSRMTLNWLINRSCFFPNSRMLYRTSSISFSCRPRHRLKSNLPRVALLVAIEMISLSMSST